MATLKRDLTSAINVYCNKKSWCGKNKIGGYNSCENKYCPLFPFRNKHTDRQTDFFRINDFQQFFDKLHTTAQSFGSHPFPWSSLRAELGIRPINNNWWGIASQMLLKRGWRYTGESKVSGTKSRKSAMERVLIKS